MTAAHFRAIVAEWGQVRERLRGEVGETAYETWIAPLDVIDVRAGKVAIAAPTDFVRDWIASHYADRIRAIWMAYNPEIRSVAVMVRPSAPPKAPPPPAELPLFDEAERRDDARRRGEDEAGPKEREASGAHEPAIEFAATGGEDYGLSARLEPRLTFEHFVVGKPNEFAVAAAERVASSDDPPFNPLFLYGGVGLGKTHLMHAIAWRVRQRDPSRRVVYLSAEKFMYQFIRALRSKDMMSFKELFRSVDVLMVDDVQFIAGKDSTQEEFFHTFNTLVDRGKQIVISADRSPTEIAGLEERIRSRLGWGLVADIHPTTYELRLGILQSKAEGMPQAHIPKTVLEFLAKRITSNVRELEGALNRIVHQATLINQPISIDVAQDVLRDLLRANERRVTIEEIQKATAEYFGIRLTDMHSARRARAVARPRQVAMYLAKQLTPRSLPEIGRKFGGRDHTTVMHAIRQIEKLSQEDRQLQEDVEQLRRQLES